MRVRVMSFIPLQKRASSSDDLFYLYSTFLHQETFLALSHSYCKITRLTDFVSKHIGFRKLKITRQPLLKIVHNRNDTAICVAYGKNI